MKTKQRAAIAYIAGRLVTGKEAAMVRDSSQRSPVGLSGTVTTEEIEVYDYQRRCRVAGTPAKPAQYNIYDYGENRQVTLSFDGNQFKGYDYGSNRQFTGTVSDDRVTIFDHAERKNFNFTI
jgi:hypothetical protein